MQDSDTPLPSDASIARVRATEVVDFDLRDPDRSDHEVACLRLKQFGFCPPTHQQAAIVTLVSPRLALRDKNFSEQVLTHRLELFSRRFFSIPPQQRQSTWETLKKRVQPFEQLNWRLDALYPGLHIDTSKIDDSDESGQLAQQICDAFVLPPNEAVAAVRRLYDRMRLPSQKVTPRKRITQLIRNHKNIAELKPGGLLSLWEHHLRDTRGAGELTPEGGRLIVVMACIVIAGMLLFGWLFLRADRSPSRKKPPTEKSSPVTRPPINLDEFRFSNAREQQESVFFNRRQDQ